MARKKIQTKPVDAETKQPEKPKKENKVEEIKAIKPASKIQRKWYRSGNYKRLI